MNIYAKKGLPPIHRLTHTSIHVCAGQRNDYISKGVIDLIASHERPRDKWQMQA